MTLLLIKDSFFFVEGEKSFGHDRLVNKKARKYH